MSALLASVPIAPARAQVDGQVYDDTRVLIADTIRHGRAQGIVTGPIAEQFRRQFQATGALKVETSVEKDLPQADCKRVQFVWTQAGAITSNGRDDAVLTMHMNICADGSPPGDLE
ncbi:hypothetical protein C6Q14_27555 [Burkholderia ambifaria]|uniref:hypothetical protein n=1 Tax=Burkholderia ambifaria TaxID=152480 RepID=UPI000CFFC3D4|nr:hypothetical protein [Burkholderia ambifaria]MBR8186492.1 hypothetical protein [Burkholderia ambifaria]PRF98086.1 hypothetical protein C6Q14_27555 [Burkholderia ambifaria]